MRYYRHYLPAVLLLLVACAVGWGAEITLFVAPDGNDSWSGELEKANATKTDGPLRSLTGARDAVRKLKAGGTFTAPVHVLLESGVYRLTEPFVLEPQDSGTEACPITYAAYPGKRAIISGGVAVDHWQKQPNGVWTAELPGAKGGQWPLRQLFVNEQRRTLARSPNTGYYTMAGQGGVAEDPRTGNKIDPSKQAFRFKPDDLKQSTNLEGGDAVIFFHWETGIFPISAVDAANETIVLAGEMHWPFWADQRYYIENVPKALDAPGEWWLDRGQGIVHYRPLPGEDPNECTIVAPRIGQLVRVNGDPSVGLYVEHVRFEGLSFWCTDYTLEPEGHCDWQAAVSVPAVIEANGARHCAIERCSLAHLGTYAIWLHWGCQDNRLVQNEITDVGAGGVKIGDGGIPPNEQVETRGNEVSNNFIHDIGIVYPGAIGVWIGQSSDNTIAHNEICDTNYTAISCGWTWGYGPTKAHRNLIEYNHLHHIGRAVLSDMGAIYTLGTSPGTKLRYNLIHDVWCYPKGYGAGGIYPDEGSSQILIENNVVYHTISGGFTLHYGKDNLCRNNIFAFARDQQVVRGRDEEHIAFNFERNIVYFDSGRVWASGGPHRNWTADNNCYWDTRGEPLQFVNDLTLDDWQKLGFDVHSIVADPGFVDPKRADFRLKPDSPALKIGFVPIDITTAGLTGPKEWVDLPKRIKRAPIDFGKVPVPEPQLIDDGFEKTPVGAAAAGCTTYGETDAATIRVTDEIAATGKRSLKFADAPGLDQPWNPHLWYSPYLIEGLARLQYDLRIEPGAQVWNEWRDAANPYRVGPSVGIDASGAMTASRQPVMTFPVNEWVHFDIVCGLGKASTATYDLTVTAPGQPAVRLEKLPCDANFKRLEWLGFVSNSTDRKVFYLDNIKLELRKG